MITRRSFLHLTALGLLPAWAGCTPSPPPPDDSPVHRGRHRVARALLGVTPGTAGLRFPATIPDDIDSPGVSCAGGVRSVVRPPIIPVVVYYPSLDHTPAEPPRDLDERFDRSVRPDPGGPFPLVLYCHARRAPPCPEELAAGVDPGLLDIGLDHRRVEFVLDHLASHGFVVCAPDVAWQWAITEEDDWPGLASARAQVLVALYDHVRELTAGPFAGAIDLNRLGLVGHSTGAAACLIARGHFADAGGPDPAACALLAPATTEPVAALAGDAGPLLVVKGTLDTRQRANPDEVYAWAGPPRVRVTIGGANHFSYTDVCAPGNQVCAGDDPPAAIGRQAQQLAAATFVGAALRRFVRDEVAMTPYLSGLRDPGLAGFGVHELIVEGDGV